MQVVELQTNQSTSVAQPNQAAQSARDRAINAYLKPAEGAQQPSQVRDLPVNDPNHVSPQELSHISPQSQSDTNGNGAVDSAPTQEATKAPTPKEDPALSSRYAALARREKALRAQAIQQQEALKAREEALRAREAALSAPTAPQPSFDPNKYISIEDLQKDPFSHLAKANLTYEQLVEQAMNAPKPDEVRMMNTVSALEAKIKSLESKLEGTEKSIKEQETASYQGAINQIRADVKQLVSRDPAFETIRVTGQQEEVVKLIEAVYKDGMGTDYPKGTVLDHYEAAKMVEDEVAESLYNWSSKSSKVAKRFQPQSAARPASQTASAQKQQTSQNSSQSVQMKTLTNQMNASRQLSARDRAILAATGQLKK